MTTTSTAGTTSTGSSNAAPLIVNGLISGINTTSVISALLQGYQAPITDLQDQQATLNSNATDYGTINTDLQSLLTDAQGLSTASSWNLMTASSSDSSVATVTSAPGATPGSSRFTVDQLAQGNVLASSGGVSSTGSVVTSATSLLLASGGQALGFSTFATSGTLALGSHTIDVTQSSAAATVTGATQLPSTTTVTTGSNDTLDVTVGSTAYSLTLAASPSGGYTPAALVAAVNAAASSAGAGVTASLSSTGALELSSTEQGSAASLSVTGGDALASLGLTAGASATGTDAIVSVDGTATTLTAITPGEQVTLPGPSGAGVVATVAATPGATGSLVSAGSATADVVSTGGGTLSDVVAAINGSGLPANASAVEDAQGNYLLQVSANNTGLAGSISVDSSAFAGGSLGSIDSLAQAQDALVSVGGANGYQLSSSSNVFTNIMAGSSVTVSQTGSASVTVSPDASGEATKVAGLVSAANQVLSDIQQYAGYNAATKTGGPLMGSSELEGIQQGVLSIFASTGGASGEGNALAAGVTVASDGTLSFNQTTFESAFRADPAKVASLFTQGGTFAPASSTYAGTVSLAYANQSTLSGSYAVEVSQSATQATDLGAVLAGGTVSTAETLNVTEGSQSASYATTAGESLAAVAAGLNGQFAAQGLGLSASVVANGTQLEIASNQYGSGASFQISSSASSSGTTGLAGTSPTTYAGTDVAGTINGVAATGDGQTLSAPLSDPTLAGLSVNVTATGITSATNLGTFSYTPGIAQKLQNLAANASDAGTGTITQVISNLQAQSTGLNSQISRYQQVEVSQQTLLQKEFASMETALGSLKNESAQVSSAINQLP